MKLIPAEQKVPVGGKDRFGRTRLEDGPSPDPAEYDFAGHMQNIYTAIMLAADPDGYGEESLGGIQRMVYEWANDRYWEWGSVRYRLAPPKRWDRELTAEEQKIRNRVTWGPAKQSLTIYPNLT